MFWIRDSSCVTLVEEQSHRVGTILTEWARSREKNNGQMCPALGRRRKTLDMSSSHGEGARLIWNAPQKFQKKDTSSAKSNS